MTLRPAFRAIARREYDSAVAWYADRRQSLGVRFVEAIDLALKRASSAPESYPVALAGMRWVRVNGFPYRIYFRASRSRLEVLAVFHVRRDPGLLRHR